MKYVMDVIKFSHDQKKSRISYGYLLNAILASLTFFTKLTFLVRSEYIKMRRVIGLDTLKKVPPKNKTILSGHRHRIVF